MNAFENLLHGFGLSWTLSKLIPYIFFPLIGFFVWAIFRKRIARRWVGFSLLLILVFGSFFAYFSVNPIFEGDFSNNSTITTLIPELESKDRPALVIVTIPDCPFCMESILRMKEFKKQNPNVSIEYRVCTSKKELLKPYQEAAGDAFPIVMAKDKDALANDVADGAFPTFVLLEKDKSVKWSNDNFGAGALDEVERAFEETSEKK